MGRCPSTTTTLPIESAPKCFQAGAVQTELFVLSGPVLALASRSISPNCLQTEKSKLPPESRHAAFWLERRLSQAPQMPGDENCRRVVASRALCFMAWQGWLRNSAAPHQRVEQQPASAVSPILGPFCGCRRRWVLLNKHLACLFLNCIRGFNELPPGTARRGRRGFPRESGRALRAARRCQRRIARPPPLRSISCPGEGTGSPCLL